MSERLQNIIAHAGLSSRRGAVAIIESGRVTVDSLVITEPGYRVEDDARVAVDGKLIHVPEKKRTIMMYKPVGVLSSMSDPFGGKTVSDILGDAVSERLVPVGRLDKESEGLLLMSNDGDLTLKLTHPRFEHEKTYIAHVAGRWNDEKLKILNGPVKMPDGYVTRPVPVKVISIREDNITVLEFRLREGRKRQIRYMCSAAHLVVTKLKRVAVGLLRLDETLEPGMWRDLTQEEIASALSSS